jgi:hypothetical protein
MHSATYTNTRHRAETGRLSWNEKEDFVIIKGRLINPETYRRLNLLLKAHNAEREDQNN